MKGVSIFFILVLFFCGSNVQVVTAGPAAYAACQTLAALSCGPAGYATCQAAAAASCHATGPGWSQWAVCYVGSQAVCASLGGVIATCYGSAQAACAAALFAPTL